MSIETGYVLITDSYPAPSSRQDFLSVEKKVQTPILTPASNSMMLESRRGNKELP